jgi:hypothetical protein
MFDSADLDNFVALNSLTRIRAETNNDLFTTERRDEVSPWTSGERLLEADMICTRMALPMAAPGEKQTARQVPPHSQLIHASSPSTILILGTRDRPRPGVCASPLHSY